ncbi:hypothetical protein RP20_CCG012890 [Aedes albopictus]|nr:hypothetical protein RP20_CCG012890 [Aedes albopictus]
MDVEQHHSWRTTSHPAKDEGDGTADEDKPLGLVLRKCIMCLLPFDELGSIETESPEELKRIVDNVYKIAKIEVTPSNGKIGPLCGSCRAKLGYNFDEDAYYEMLSKMYSETGAQSHQTLGIIPLVVPRGQQPPGGPENSDYPSPGSPLLDAACGTLVVTEMGRDESDTSSDLKCVICSKVFNFKSTLRLHIRSHHNSTTIREPETHKIPRKPRMYECIECNLSFKLKYDYDKHQAMHNRANLFQCDTCYKLFKHKSYYLMHRNAKRCKAMPLNLSADGTLATNCSNTNPTI